VNRVLTQTLKSMPRNASSFLDHCNLVYLRSLSPLRIGISGGEEASQATNGDDSVTWAGKLK